MSGACATETATTTTVGASTSSSTSSTTEVTAVQPTTSTTVETSTTTTTTAPLPTTTLPAFPPERASLEHGADTWVVVLAGSDTPDDPVLADAILAAEEAGYTTGATDCDDGAPEALGQPDGNSTVSVYLGNEADAHAALLAFEARGVSGVVAQVQTFCLD
ncbi:MAG TPA: hypothetical protein VE027_13440 [Acidimicrobiia bacterium]|nr:hypothetical protein [Acidimicrobiia bacterium]